MRVILKHNFLSEKGFDLKGIRACDVRLLGDAMTPLQIPETPYIGQRPQKSGHDHDQDPWIICSAGLVIHDSGRSTTLGGVLEVDGTSLGLTAGHVLNDVPAPQVNTTNQQDLILYDSDWALESPDESEEDHCSDQELEEDELPDCEEQSMLYVHETVYADIPGLKPRVQSLRVVAAFVPNTSRSQQACDWVLIELPDALQNKANATGGYDNQIVHEIEVAPPQGRVILLTRRGQIDCHWAGSASSIKPIGSETFMDVWSLCSNHVLGNTFLKITVVHWDANEVQEPGDSGSWAIDRVSNKLLGVVVANSNTTGEVFIIPAKAILADIKLMLRANDVRLPRYCPNDSLKAMEIPTTTADRSITVRQLKLQLDQQSVPSAPAANVPAQPLLRALIEDESMRDIPKAIESSWKPYRMGGSTLDIGDSSHKSSHSVISQIPSNLSFQVTVEEIRPTGRYPYRSSNHPQGEFIPPNQKDGYNLGLCHCFRFKHGVFGPGTVKDHADIYDMQVRSVATVLGQAWSTDHLLMVPYDARSLDLLNCSYDWSDLTFEHKRRNISSSFASLAWSGQHKELPAPIPPEWDQLIPQPYRHQEFDVEGKQIKPDTIFAGLIGELPLLIALIAFSVVPSELYTVLENHVKNGKWIAPTQGSDIQLESNYADLPRRGLVVTIYLDPSNPSGSTNEELDRLECGDYGPFLEP